MHIPAIIHNYVDGRIMEVPSAKKISKYNPHTGELLSTLPDSTAENVNDAVGVATRAFEAWSQLTPVRRGQILGDIVTRIKARREEFEKIVAVETGKPLQDARGEMNAAILQGEFFAGEGMRLYSRALTSG